MRCAILRKHEPGVCAHLRALRKAATRGERHRRRATPARASSARPGRTARPPGNVPEVPQVISSRKQILRILWHPSARNRRRRWRRLRARSL